MSNRPVVAVDVMGGDNAPAYEVAGALLAARQWQIPIVLFLQSVGGDVDSASADAMRLPRRAFETVRLGRAVVALGGRIDGETLAAVEVLAAPDGVFRDGFEPLLTRGSRATHAPWR